MNYSLEAGRQMETAGPPGEVMILVDGYNHGFWSNISPRTAAENIFSMYKDAGMTRWPFVVTTVTAPSIFLLEKFNELPARRNLKATSGNVTLEELDDKLEVHTFGILPTGVCEQELPKQVTIEPGNNNHTVNGFRIVYDPEVGDFVYHHAWERHVHPDGTVTRPERRRK